MTTIYSLPEWYAGWLLQFSSDSEQVPQAIDLMSWRLLNAAAVLASSLDRVAEAIEGMKGERDE